MNFVNNRKHKYRQIYLSRQIFSKFDDKLGLLKFTTYATFKLNIFKI